MKGCFCTAKESGDGSGKSPKPSVLRIVYGTVLLAVRAGVGFRAKGVSIAKKFGLE